MKAGAVGSKPDRFSLVATARADLVRRVARRLRPGGFALCAALALACTKSGTSARLPTPIPASTSTPVPAATATVARALCQPGARPGGILVTGHDADFHSVFGQNTAGAQRFLQRAVAYVSYGKASPRILLVTDVEDPGMGRTDPRTGLRAAGLSFDVADYGSGAVGNLNQVDFAGYDLVVVASDPLGWLRQREVDALIARSDDLIRFVNSGGGLVVLAESGPSPQSLIERNRFGFLPFLESRSKSQTEVGFRVTPPGIALGLSDADVNGNISHSVFVRTGDLEVFEVDAAGEAVTVGTRGNVIGRQGVAMRCA